MTKFSNKFWAHFPNLGGNKIFPENPALSQHNFTWDSSTMPKFSKIWRHDSKKTLRETEGQMEGQKDGRMDRPYFIGPFQLPPGVPKFSKQLTHILQFLLFLGSFLMK